MSRKCCGAPRSWASSYQRIDAGMAFGRNTEPDYLAMNPNGRVPTLVDGDFVLWESNSIMRYFALVHGQGSPIYPDAPKLRAAVDRWLDWTLSTLQPVDRPVFWALVRTPGGKTRHDRHPEGCRRGSRGMADSRGPIGDPKIHRRRVNSRWPILRSALTRAAGSGSKASASRDCRISNAGSRNSPAAPDSRNSSPRR